MAENVILAEQTYEGFSYDSEFRIYKFNINPSPFTIVLGELYSIVWDNVQYSCEAQDMSALGEGVLGLGNLSVVGGVGNDEPFIIGWSNNGTTLFSFDTETSHTIAIYQVVEEEEEEEEEEEVGIVIKNYGGTPIEYKGVEKVMFNTADGGKRVYSKGEALENVSIELDFSSGDQTVKAADGTLVKSAVIKKPDTLVAENIKSGVSVAGIEGALTGSGEEVIVPLDMSDGDMVIEPSDGKLFSSVTVEKPDTLIPENIAEGVDIAGIIGTLVAGGGGGNVKIAGGTFTGNGKGVVVTHNLGVVPDIVFALITGSTGTIGSMTANVSACTFFHVTNAVRDSLGITKSQRTIYPNSSKAVYVSGLTSDSGADRTVYNKTETQMTIGSSFEQTVSGKTYCWIAIGGLT